jgi:hypothetical protein
VPAGGEDEPVALEDPPQVGRVDRVAEDGGVDVGELAHREPLGHEGERGVGVRQLPAQALVRAGDRGRVPERDRGEGADRVPRRVRGQGGLGLARDERDVAHVDQPRPGRARARAELLEVGDPGDADLGQQLAAHRVVEALARVHEAAGSDQTSPSGRRQSSVSSSSPARSTTALTTTWAAFRVIVGKQCRLRACPC